MSKPILCLDFDGVCHAYTSGWKGADNIPDPAVDGMFEFFEEAKEYFDIQIFSSRSHQLGGVEAMVTWFMEQRKLWRARGNKPPIDTPLELSFPLEKPPAMVGIDDRVLLFTGKWPTVMELKDFKPWNLRGSEPKFGYPQEALEEILGHVTAALESTGKDSFGVNVTKGAVNVEWIKLRALRGLGRQER